MTTAVSTLTTRPSLRLALKLDAAGTAWIVMQAIVVAGFAALQLAGLRKG